MTAGITQLPAQIQAIKARQRQIQHNRIEAFFGRLQTQLRQVLRESQMREGIQLAVAPEAAAEMMVIYVEGRMRQFLRTRFQVSPLSNWEAEWHILDAGIFG